MTGYGSCSSLIGGKRHRTRKSHRRRQHRGGSIMNNINNLFGKFISGVGKVTTMGEHAASSATKEVKQPFAGGRKSRRARTHRRTQYRHPKKGQRSRTRKGRRDFTTKKSSRVFNRRGHYQRRSSKGVKRRPFRTHKRR